MRNIYTSAGVVRVTETPGQGVNLTIINDTKLTHAELSLGKRNAQQLAHNLLAVTDTRRGRHER